MKPPPEPWRSPSELPDLRRVGIIALDTETRDDGLRADRGSAWPWRGGYICGISVAWRDDSGIRGSYFPLRHPDSKNFECENVARWLKDLLASGVRIVTQNGLYDWGWLWADLGIAMPPSKQLEEIGALATLIDENRFSYGLDKLCEWRGLPGKDTALLEEAVRAAGFKVSKKSPVQSYIWQLPAHLGGRYAERDPIATLALFENLNPILDQQGTRAAYRLDVGLLPMVHEMRRRGIRVDQSAAEQARDYCLQKRNAALTELSEQLGSPVSMEEIASPIWKARTFDTHRISYPRTPKDNPSFRAGKTGWMIAHPHWLPRLIATANKYQHAGSTFLEGHVLSHLIGDRIYGEINPHRSEEGGTKSFRFSYASPPLQQMPSRDPELGPLIRSVFLPEDGEIWCTVDCSQQEFRLLVHHAAQRNLSGAKAMAELYRTNPTTDIHDTVAERLKINRTTAKNVNYAKIYGAGLKKFAEMIGKPEAETRAIIAKYDAQLPFVPMLSRIAQQMAVRNGYTELYDGARRHWDLYEVPGISGKGAGPCDLDEARRRAADPEHRWFGQLPQRYKTYTALNAQIQGDAARHTKLWMRAVWREGIVPLLQMHDGLELSVTTREQGELVAQLACEAVKLEVPMRAKITFGRNWGEAKYAWEDLTGESTPTPTTRPKPAAEVSQRHAPEPEPKPTPPVPTSPRPPAAPAAPAQAKPAHHNGADIRTVRPAQSSIAFPAFDVREVATIDLAELIDEPVPKNRKICCRFHDEATPSLHIYHDHYYCFGCHAYGDHIDWLMQIEGLDHAAAQDVLTNWTGPVISQCTAAGRALEEIAEAEKNRAYVLRWWDAAKPIRGTLAARYLADIRGIDLDALPDNVDDTLRFHPRCVFGPGIRQPCLIALMRDACGDAPVGIQRIALTPDAQKIDRRMLGTAGVVKLWPASTASLVVGEGLETVLAAATRLPYHDAPLQPAWAALSDGALKNFPIIDGVKRLIVLADNDVNNAGAVAAEACKRRWLEAGRRVALLMPDRPDTDFNDVVLATLERAL
jgi:DNA polymerase I-like protein with 3'-5' exonuclease and polymerase domains